MRCAIAAGLFGSTILFASGCGSSGDPKVTMVDLDKVLEIFEATMKEMPNEGPKQAANNQDGKADPKAPGQLPEVKNDPKKTEAFLKKFAANLNAKKMIEEPIGVQMERNGTITGFIDKDKNMKMSGTAEKKLFEIQIDVQKNRLVASQTVEGQSYHRDRAYRPRFGGLFMGYMLGSMMSRQRSHYGGRNPGFTRKMSPRGYYSSARSSAVSRARTRTGRSSGARRGGSRGFRGGK